MNIRLFASALAFATLGACGSTRAIPDDAAPPPPPPIDAPDVPIDAPPDAPTVSPQGQDLSNVGGRMTGTTYTMDVQLGHPTPQTPMSGTTHTLEANTPIKP